MNGWFIVTSPSKRITRCRFVSEDADDSWRHQTLLLTAKRSDSPFLAGDKRQLYGIVLAVHHAGSHTEKKLGGARDSPFRITV
ncbi:hypothetical protein Q5P01_025240 [Channa striata]|uniref:Uncharacterized protein n=1 Tax=Channa striata TaxID=64152 RepID=A0AA88LI19_CHASR|nr:hypothetical protein Q5P01_025240 [Channa striata]